MLIGQKSGGGRRASCVSNSGRAARLAILIDIIPAQLAAEKLARLSGADSDTFRYCSFIVEDEFGLLQAEPKLPKQ